MPTWCLLCNVGREVRDDDVGTGHEGADEVEPFGRRKVGRDASLVAVHVQEGRAHTVGPHRADEPVLATAHLLDPNDVSAKIGQKASAVWGGDVAAKVDNPDPSQWPAMGHQTGH